MEINLTILKGRGEGNLQRSGNTWGFRHSGQILTFSSTSIVGLQARGNISRVSRLAVLLAKKKSRLAVQHTEEAS